ncbi:nucleoid-associated protein [Shewanella algae]|uniref:nucleoid-associated protein n=1 Tax=Shewanella algae TaxID=38313 RepID=UPI001AAD5E79|nr:nucleoid-associated protein [Shewanella algae]MBO2563774.1 nucleoid-associated protein [Shewanella algae]
MKILNVILHNIKKNEDKSAVEEKLRPNENENDDSANYLGKSINEIFNKTGLSMGHFIIKKNDDDVGSHVETLLKKYYVGDNFTDFVKFTQSCTLHLKKKLQDKSAIKAKGGHVWFNHYMHAEQHFLSIVLLRQKVSTRIEDLSLKQFDSVDLDKLHMGARINLTKWSKSTGASKYISFKIGREAKAVTDYFSKFIGCEAFTAAKVDTRAMISVINSYCDTHNIENEKKEHLKSFVYTTIFDSLSKGDTTVKIDRISDLLDSKFEIDEEKKGVFLKTAQGKPYYLNNEISPDKTELNRLKRYYGKNNDVSVSFSSNLLNVSVFYDKKKGVLTIKDVPEALKQQLSN